MFLDAPTLVLAVTLVTGTSALACLMSWRASPGHDLPLIFGGAFLSETLAMALQFDRSALPLLVTVDLSNALALLCSALIWAGHRHADGRATPILLILLAPLVWLLACRIPEFYGRYDRRVLLAALLHGVLFAVAAWELWRGRAERISARWWMFAAMIGSVAIMAFRAAAMLVSSDLARFHFLPDFSLGLITDRAFQAVLHNLDEPGDTIEPEDRLWLLPEGLIPDAPLHVLASLAAVVRAGRKVVVMADSAEAGNRACEAIGQALDARQGSA